MVSHPGFVGYVFRAGHVILFQDCHTSDHHPGHLLRCGRVDRLLTLYCLPGRVVRQEKGIGLRDHVVGHGAGGRGVAAVAGTFLVRVWTSDYPPNLGRGGFRLDGAVGVVFET